MYESMRMRGASPRLKSRRNILLHSRRLNLSSRRSDPVSLRLRRFFRRFYLVQVFRAQHGRERQGKS